MKKLVILVAALVTAFSAMAFTKGQTPESVKAEVAQRVKDGESDEAIARAALAVGIPAAAVQSALVAANRPAQAVFAALSSIPGVDITTLTQPTAAGPTQVADNSQGGGVGGGGNAGSGGNRSSNLSGGGTYTGK